MHLDFKIDIYGLNKWHFINSNCPFTECEYGMTSSTYSSRISIGVIALVLFFQKNSNVIVLHESEISKGKNR